MLAFKSSYALTDEQRLAVEAFRRSIESDLPPATARSLLAARACASYAFALSRGRDADDPIAWGRFFRAVAALTEMCEPASASARRLRALLAENADLVEL